MSPVRLLSIAVFGIGLLLAMLIGANAQETAIVSTRIIYPGQVVSGEALQEVALNWHPTAPIVRAPEEIEGKVARRTLLPGRLIPTGSVREPYLVETGSPVTVMFVEGGLTISTKAVALQSGAAGDMIRLRNMDSGVVLSGIVLADGTVRIGAS